MGNNLHSVSKKGIKFYHHPKLHSEFVGCFCVCVCICKHTFLKVKLQMIIGQIIVIVLFSTFKGPQVTG